MLGVLQEALQALNANSATGFFNAQGAIIKLLTLE